MSDLSTITIVDAYRYTSDDLDLSGNDLFALALDQRAFGPRRFVVVTARHNGQVVGLAHCKRTEPPEMALRCCLDTLDDGAAVAVAYSDEPVSVDPPADLRQRLDTARVAAQEFGVYLVDWVLCDDDLMRSMRITLQDPDHRWDVPPPGFPPATPHRLAGSRSRSSRRPHRSPRKPGGR